MGSRRTGNGVERVYDAAQKWVDCALRTDGSLFTPGEVIWTAENLEVLHEKFLNSPDESSRSFLEKLEEQLSGSPAAAFQLMGECLYFYFLIVHTKNGADEKKVIDTVLQWSELPAEMSSELVDALTPGIATPGTAYHTFRPFQVGLLIEFAERLKQEDRSELGPLLDDPWKFKRFLMDFRPSSRLVSKYQNASRIQRQVLLHLVHPDTFEGIVSEDHKNAIADAFSTRITEPTEDVDFQLQQIRTSIERELERDFHFYEADIRSKWERDFEADPWDEFIKLAREFIDSGELESQEIEYKVDIAHKLEATRDAVLAGTGNWIELLGRAISPVQGHPMDWRAGSRFMEWCNNYPDDSLKALQTIWTRDDLSVAERIKAFSDVLPKSVVKGTGTRMRAISVFLMGLDVRKYPPYMWSTFTAAYRYTEYDEVGWNRNEAGQYENAMGFLDRFIDEAAKRGLMLRDRLDAQSVVWAIQDRLISTEDDQELLPTESETNLEELANQTFLPVEFLEEIEILLEEKKQVIFQGPPGTGKTYIAQEFAQHFAEADDDVTIVQFHPSYAYEDFVQGFRPVTLKNGQPGFELRDGPLLRAAERARSDPDWRHYLIIDEINRGNLAKVLGELYFLLEYRDKEIQLQYSDKPFSLPENLYIIGTMNTADRSIASVDTALRRRFYFTLFHPDEEPVKSVLRNWLRENEPDMEWVVDVVDRANEKLKDDRHAAIGPSYFMREGLDDAAVERIWRHSVLPYIEERRFGDREGLDEFDLDKLKRETTRGNGQESDEGGIE